MQLKVDALVDRVIRQGRIGRHERERWRRRITDRLEAARELPAVGATRPVTDIVWDGTEAELAKRYIALLEAGVDVTEDELALLRASGVTTRRPALTAADRDAAIRVAGEIAGLSPDECWRVIGRRPGAGRIEQRQRVDAAAEGLRDRIASRSVVTYNESGDEVIEERHYDGAAADVFVQSVIDREPALAQAIVSHEACLAQLVARHDARRTDEETSAEIELRAELDSIARKTSTEWQRYRARLEATLTFLESGSPDAAAKSLLTRLQPRSEQLSG